MKRALLQGLHALLPTPRLAERKCIDQGDMGSQTVAEAVVFKASHMKITSKSHAAH
jgi:hypothetical protein